MEKQFYAIQSHFYAYIKENPCLLLYVSELSKHQIEKILIEIDLFDLQKRAISYFGTDKIYLEDQTLYYENAFHAQTYRMQLSEYGITLHDCDKNPFFPFLKRIYRHYCYI